MKKIYCADLFCGGGGTSTGMIAAFEKRGVDYELVGVNHWDKAIETNRLNHRGRYRRDGVERVSPRELVPGGRLHILWASPECTNHSRAKGGRPKDEQSRATAWDVLKWPQELFIDRIYIENVEEFLEWGPCDETGHPIAKKKGEIFRQYIRALKAFGYRVDYQVMNAADFGAPTCRRRLIIQAVRGRNQKIRWPEPTHAKVPGLFGEKPWRAAREIIDWNIKGTSIFERKKPLAANTLRRIYSGIAKHGGRYADRFGVALRREIVRSCKFSGRCPFDVLASLPPVAARAEAAPFITVMRGTSPAQDNASIRATDSPLASISTNGHEGLVTAFVTRYNGGDDRNHSVSAPVPVVDCSNRYGLVEPFVFATGQTSAGARSTSISAPISTVVTKAEHCIVEPMLLSHKFDNVPVSVSAPCPVVVTSGAVGVINPLIVSHKFDNVPVSAASPLPTLTTVNGFSLAAPLVVSLRGTAEGNLDRSAVSVSQTLPTVTAGGTHLAVAEPSVIDMSHPAEESGARVRSAEEPMFVPQHGGGTVKPVSHPLPTIATTGSISVVSPVLVKFYGGEEEAHSVDKPLGTVTCKDRFGLADGRLVVDEWGRFLLLDILFRMLQPHELAAAMSFPENYKFAGTKSDQVKQIGNAVCPALAEALIAAALDDLDDVLNDAA